MRLRRSTRVILGVLGLALLVGYPVAFLFSVSKPIILAIPNPNGYDDLIRAARLVAGTPPKFAPQFAQIVPSLAGPARNKHGQAPGTWEPVPAYLEANREALAMLRVGLGRECVVPINFEQGYNTSTFGMRAGFRSLAELLFWEARLALHEGRPADAARAYLDVVRLGRAVSRGGIEADLWVGNHIEGGGLLGLGLVVDGLGPDDCRTITATLRDLDAAREPYASIDARNTAQVDAEPKSLRRFVNRTYDRFVLHYKDVFDADRVRRCDETLAVSRMVQVELALRACRVETGSEPDNIAGLVPKYLSGVPLDPFSGRPPVYRKAADGHILYCLGANRVDDGGVKPPARAPFARPTGDLFIDSVESPHRP